MRSVCRSLVSPSVLSPTPRAALPVGSDRGGLESTLVPDPMPAWPSLAIGLVRARLREQAREPAAIAAGHTSSSLRA